MSEYNPIINQVVLVVISVGLPLLLRWLFDDVLKALTAQYLSRVDERTRYEVAELIDTAIHAAEQMGLTGELERLGKNKLDYAIDLVDKELNRRGIDLDMDAIRAMIQAAVKQSFNTPRGQG